MMKPIKMYAVVFAARDGTEGGRWNAPRAAAGMVTVSAGSGLVGTE